MSDLTLSHAFQASFWGVIRGGLVHSLIHPLEVIKIHQQCNPNPIKSTQVALELFKKEGIGGFYKGIEAQLTKTTMKQLWCWPMMIALPPILDGHQVGKLQQQALTGVAIATIDAGSSTPIEKAKFTTILAEKKTFSPSDLYKEGWRGFGVNWLTLSVKWSSFLVAQKALRDAALEKTGQVKLTLPELSGIGVAVAVVVSIVSAPLDNLKTLRFGKNQNSSHLLQGNILRKIFRGTPLTTLSLFIHNIASVTLLDQLEQRGER